MTTTPFTQDAEGVWHSLDEQTYRQASGVNISALKAMGKSPAHYYLQRHGPKPEPTPAMIFGSMLHAALLEPERPPQYVVKPEEINLRTKEGKAWKDAQTLPVITKEESEKITTCVQTMHQHETVRYILGKSAGQREVSVFRRDPATGLLCKGRLDIVVEDTQGNTVICDVKTCLDASPGQFRRTVAMFGYEQQAAFYLDLLGAEHFMFIAIEKEPPHGIGVYVLDGEAIEIGRETNARNLAAVSKCQETGQWPSYPTGIKTLTLPAWVKHASLDAQQDADQ
jgi:hypothetical protein